MMKFILGGTPSEWQKAYFFLWMVSLLFWPFALFMSGFMLDYPIQSPLDETCREWMHFIIVCYPGLVFLSLAFGFRLSQWLKNPIPYILLPAMIVIAFCVFYHIDEGEKSRLKPSNETTSVSIKFNEHLISKSCERIIIPSVRQ